MTPDLPADLKAGLEALARGKSGREIARRSAALTNLYRSGSGSADAIKTAEDALAYALVRLPATYAATSAVLAALSDAFPDFSPASLLDVGAGPGTATFAAAQVFPDLREFHLVDDNAPLRDVALVLLGSSETHALREAAYVRGEISSLRERAPADLVVASYVVGELAPESLLHRVELLWARTRHMLAVIEPGTPAGFARIRSLRAHLIAQGAHVVAPCPHDRACPIVDPDWCHFSQRLPRSRAHRQVKGAALAFEDEKFSYVVLARERPPGIDARVLAHPQVSKGGISAKLCTREGIVTETAGRRDPDRYKRLKTWRWGAAVTRPPLSQKR